MTKNLENLEQKHLDELEPVDQIHLDGIDLSDLSLEGLEITALGDAMNVPEMGASSGVSSCDSCSCCVSTSCCSLEAPEDI